MRRSVDRTNRYRRPITGLSAVMRPYAPVIKPAKSVMKVGQSVIENRAITEIIDAQVLQGLVVTATFVVAKKGYTTGLLFASCGPHRGPYDLVAECAD